MQISVGVVGATGYTGLELVRYLLRHPSVKVNYLFSKSQIGKSFQEIYPHFYAAPNFELKAFDVTKLPKDLDLLFLAIPHGESHQFLGKLIKEKPDLKVIDLSADFRLQDLDVYQTFYKFKHQSQEALGGAVYGVPELFRDQIKKTKLCANPGCYAITSILGLYPLKDDLKDLGPVVIDAKTGVTGAGKTLNDVTHFCEVDEAFSAYNTGVHRHSAEIENYLGYQDIFFSPHLIPQQRGIFATIYLQNKKKWTEKDLVTKFEKAYKDEPFTKVLNDIPRPSSKLVNGSNYCCVIPKVIGDKLVIFSLTDNLMKGAAGQAIQNMNLMCGFEETEGLGDFPNYF